MPKAANTSFPERKKAAMLDKINIWQSRAARLLVVLLLCFQPLYFHPIERYHQLVLHKWSFFLFCMIVTLICIIAIWIYRLTRNPKLLPSDRLRYFDWAVLSFAAITIISTLFSPFREYMNLWIGIPEPHGRYDGAITQLLYVVVYFIVSRWYRPNVKDFAFFGISASLVGLIGILQFYGMDIFSLWPNHLPEFRRPDFFDIFFRTTIGNVNMVATFATIAILLCSFLFIRLKSKWQPLWLVAGALNFWLLDIAGSDSGLVGIAVTLFFAIPFIIESRKYIGRTLLVLSSWVGVFTLQRLLFQANILNISSINRFFEYRDMSLTPVGSLLPFMLIFAVLLIAGVLLSKFSSERAPDAKPKWKLGVILIAASLIIGIVGVEAMGREEAERGEGFAGRLLFEAREVMHGNLRDEMGSGRIYIWRNALAAVPNAPIIGTGPDTFEQAVFPDETHIFMGARFDTAHNEYIQILLSQGILGLLAYLTFLVGVFLCAIKKTFKNPMIMAVTATFFGYLVQAFFNISTPIISMALWVLAGMMANKRFEEEPS